MNPPGSLPGIRSFAIAPITRPISTTPSQCIVFSPILRCSNHSVIERGRVYTPAPVCSVLQFSNQWVFATCVVSLTPRSYEHLRSGQYVTVTASSHSNLMLKTNCGWDMRSLTYASGITRTRRSQPLRCRRVSSAVDTLWPITLCVSPRSTRKGGDYPTSAR